MDCKMEERLMKIKEVDYGYKVRNWNEGKLHYGNIDKYIEYCENKWP